MQPLGSELHSVRRGHGGRPRAADAALIGDRIIAAASLLFLRDGYAATSVESIASSAGVSKRTFYARFTGKSEAFLAVTRMLLRGWLDVFDEALETAHSLEDTLLTTARTMLDVALTPAALALHALITAEAGRLPELAELVRQSGMDVGVARVAALLQVHCPGLAAEQARFIAEQFQSMVVTAPQRRAMLTGYPPDASDRDTWCRWTVELVLHGIPAAPRLPQ